MAVAVVGGLSHPVSAANQKGTCASTGAFSSSGTCTVLPGETISFTIKGGNGGPGGNGGQGGKGGDSFNYYDGNDMVPPSICKGEPASVGATGGLGGAGAKVSGSYTNNSGSTVTLTVTVGANGTAGANGTNGAAGANSVSSAPGNDGQPGTNGVDGLAGTATQIVSGTVIAAAGGGSGGMGGQGSFGGAGGLFSPACQASATPSAPPPPPAAADGSAGTVTPWPLPSGWSTPSTTSSESPALTVTGNGVSVIITTTTSSPTTTTTSGKTPSKPGGSTLKIPRIYGPGPLRVAKSFGMSVPDGATGSFAIATKSKNFCKISAAGNLLSLKTGNCTVTVTLKLKSGTTSSKTGTLPTL